MHTAVKMYLTEDSIIKFNPLNPRIKIWILVRCPYSFPTDIVGREVDKTSSKFILCDHASNSHDYSVLQSIDNYYKEKFDADHS